MSDKIIHARTIEDLSLSEAKLLDQNSLLIAERDLYKKSAEDNGCEWAEDTEGIIWCQNTFESKWKALNKSLQEDLAFHKSGEMQSLAESIHGEANVERMLEKMKRLEASK